MLCFRQNVVKHITKQKFEQTSNCYSFKGVAIGWLHARLTPVHTDECECGESDGMMELASYYWRNKEDLTSSTRPNPPTPNVAITERSLSFNLVYSESILKNNNVLELNSQYIFMPIYNF